MWVISFIKTETERKEFNAMNSYLKFYQQSGQMIIVEQQCFTSSNVLIEGK